MITTVTLIVLFVAVQTVANLSALLFSNLEHAGQRRASKRAERAPVNLGISMLIGELLLSFGLWWWFYHVEKPVRLRSIDNPEIAGIFKFRPFKQEVTPRCISLWQIAAAVCGALFLSIGLSELLEYLHLADNSDLQLFKDTSRNPWCILLMCIV